MRIKPYSVTAIINEKSSEIEEMKCLDCAASAGGCKHSIAFLMWLHRRSEEPAPTTVVCYWKKPVMSQIGSNIKYIKSVDVCKPFKKPKVKILPSDNFLDDVIAMTKKHNYVCFPFIFS